jgi:hypothetical protein
VASIARLLWRKNNLATFRIAASARRDWQLARDGTFKRTLAFWNGKDRPKIEDALDDLHKARKEFGERYKFIEIGDIATLDQLMKDLIVEERLDAMIDKCIKRLLFLRGLKSISQTSSSAPAPLARIAGPQKPTDGQAVHQ